jgi:hypothetical protein
VAEIFRDGSETAQIHNVYFSATIDNLRKTDIFPKDFVPPRGIQSNFYKKLRSTTSLQEASIVVVPHEWYDIINNWEYVNYLNKLSDVLPIVIFNTGDVSPPVNITNSFEIRTFLHPGENPEGKVLIPYPTKRRKFKLRKWDKVPRIGFMGQIPKISPGSLVSRPNFSFLNPIKSSAYLNRKIGVTRLRNLDRKIETNVVVRPSFSAIYGNPNLNSQSAEFQAQLFSCDYILCPRGFGNTSIRFYETISAGRTPILIDTDGGLPQLLSGNVWENHIINVGLFENWTKLILKDWENLSVEDNYLKRQLSNLELFDSQLDFEKYMEILFSRYLEKKA